MEYIDNEIQYLATDTSATIYWEKPEVFLEGRDSYQILLNDAIYGETDKTHSSLYGLEPDTEYMIQIILVRNSAEMARLGEIQIRTHSTKKVLDITKAPYGATGDGNTLNTDAIQRAIDACGADTMVYIPKGIFMTGALRLHSDMELYLEKGAVLQGTDRREDYLPLIPSRFEGTEMMCYSSLLNLGKLDRGGYHCHNVVIRGEGTIAGGGKKLAERIIAYETEHLKEYMRSLGDQLCECEKPETIPGRLRPRLINISSCRNVSISGLTLRDGPCWNVHMIYSENIVTDHCIFCSEGVWNGDGWDPDSSRNCTIFACTFYTGDDSIAVKSGKNPQGNEIGRPCEKIRIFDCVCKQGHGIAVGSEMSGGVRDVKIWDCDLSDSKWGIEIKGTEKRGGYVSDIHVRNCTVPRILFHAVSYNDDGIAAPTPPVFEKCSFTDVSVLGSIRVEGGGRENCAVIELCGFDKEGYELRDIVFSRVRMPDRKGSAETGQMILMKNCRNIQFTEMTVD